MSYDVDGWDQLRSEIGDGADQWLDVIEDLISESNDYDALMSIAGSPSLLCSKLAAHGCSSVQSTGPRATPSALLPCSADCRLDSCRVDKKMASH